MIKLYNIFEEVILESKKLITELDDDGYSRVPKREPQMKPEPRVEPEPQIEPEQPKRKKEPLGKEDGEHVVHGTPSREDILRAMNTRYRYKIMYQGKGDDAPHPRYVDFYLKGKTKLGNDNVFAYQASGYSKGGGAGWKFFLIDRISYMEKTKMHAGNEPISNYDSRIPSYKGTHKLMQDIEPIKRF